MSSSTKEEKILGDGKVRDFFFVPVAVENFQRPEHLLAFVFRPPEAT